MLPHPAWPLWLHGDHLLASGYPCTLPERQSDLPRYSGVVLRQLRYFGNYVTTRSTRLGMNAFSVHFVTQYHWVPGLVIAANLYTLLCRSDYRFTELP